MLLSPHFTLEELTVTRHAAIGNTPSAAVVDDLSRLAQFMEQVRAVLGHPIIISSGYRSFAVNQAVGGSKNSAHLQGRAADFTCPGYGTPYQVCRAIIDAGLEFDQLINEPGWVHIAIAKNTREDVLTKMQDGRYVLGLHDLDVFHA